MQSPAPAPLLTHLLRDVSRSFYLTMRALPAAIRPQISLAYLLARTTDTIADTEIVPVSQRLEALQALRARILGTRSEPLVFRELARQQGLPAERVLLERVEEAIHVLDSFAAEDQQRIHQVLTIITSGQELDLRRFGEPARDRIVALQNDVELEDYTYRVAGCVGEFWSRMCRAHLFSHLKLDEPAWLADGVRFGKGLQLVNILRDLPADLRKGRCYIPEPKLATVGLSVRDLREPASISRFRPLYREYLAQARAHLAAGWDYIEVLPLTCVRVRLACAWPVLIGVQTLDRLQTGNVLDATQRLKVTRADVRRIVARTLVWYPWPAKWRRLFQETDRPEKVQPTGAAT